MANGSSMVAPQARNRGASINIISGIQGVAPGAEASVNMPVANRIHRETFQCSGIAYPAAGSTVVLSSAGNGAAVLTPTVINGVVTAITITTPGSTYAAGTFTVVDPAGNGTGANGTYTVDGGGAINGVTLLSGGVVSPVDPGYFFTSVKHLVNGIVMRDIPAADVLKIARANGEVPEAGEFPVFFTEPWRKIVDYDQATAWDLFGQSTYQILLGIRSNITSPSVQGVYEFDYLRNAIPGEGGEPMLFLRPIKQHRFTYVVPAGVFNVPNLPVNFPIQRIWMYETGPGSIERIELYQDGNKVMEGTYEQINQMLQQYQFVTTPFDFSVVFDPDQRLGKALFVDNLVLRIYSAANTTLNIVMEIQANNYA